MSQELADLVRGKCGVVAVCNAYKLAPWADALVCNDRAWWMVHRDALKFQGKKYCAFAAPGVEVLPTNSVYQAGTNSGLQGCRVAAMLGATRILLLGFDMKGSHYFGPHPKPLKNTTPGRYKAFIQQFSRWNGPEIINCTPGSALTRFPFGDVREILADGG